MTTATDSTASTAPGNVTFGDGHDVAVNGAGSGAALSPGGVARALTSAERRGAAVVAGGTGLLGLLGFANSFSRVQAAAAGSFGVLAWTVPLGVDTGIAVFAGLDIVLARLDLRPRWLRLIPWALTAATVYLNIAGEHTWFGRVAHAVLPGLWVVAVEVAAYALRRCAGLASATRMDRIRRSRWLLAPTATVALWRRMVLWEIRSYPAALARERDRLLTLTTLQDTYGRLGWRWKAPRRERLLYRLGELTPHTATPTTPEPTTTIPHSEDGVHPAVHAVNAPPAAGATAPPARGASKRARLAELVAQVPADDPRTAAQLARDLAPRVDLHPGTARRYLTTAHTGAAQPHHPVRDSRRSSGARETREERKDRE